ncbi:MAG: asparagine synthase (glutamine-hydrolyzing) [Acidimicrobiia bacterium]|nr:asparagine synthase (glutamine-hydrolyzing) [Acidimicrobiia bacterium]
MCGIAGCVDRRDVNTDVVDLVERQLRLLDHRGPDSSGVFPGRGAAIGQTRLAVIDLLTGDPPVANEDGTLGAVLNGEIYNYQALRAELARDGHKLATEGDTEVIAHLAETLDPVGLARRLDGMFAFAIWDDRRRRLTLGRDPLGKKPLYYWCDGDTFVFASEVKALLADPRVPRRLDGDAIPAYLTFGYVPTPRTMYEGIRSVPPGHVLTFDPGAAGDPLRLEPYWQPRVPGVGGAQRVDLGVDECAAEVRSRLTAAVRRRLIADVPVGAFLSGGVDSSMIVALMAEVSPGPVRTFTIGFEDTEGFDERPYARQVAERYATEHVEFVVKPDAVNLVERLLWHHDVPFGDSSAIPTYLLAELTRRHVTVALCGDGGDELFAGYERFTGALLVQELAPLFTVLRPPLARALSALDQRSRAGSGHTRLSAARRLLARTELGLPDAFMAWVSFVLPEWRRRLTGDAESWATEDYRRVWAATDGCDTLDRLLDLNLRTYLLDDLLPKVDRMAMAHALEVRSPFLDRDFVEFALRLPRSARVRGPGLSRKRALKAAARPLLPPTILRRRKRGFGVPLDRWFRTDLHEFLTAMLGAPTARVRAHVDGAAVDELLAEHQRGAANHGTPLWTLLTLEVFLRREGW